MQNFTNFMQNDIKKHHAEQTKNNPLWAHKVRKIIDN